MALVNIVPGSGLTNEQFLDWLLARVNNKDKGTFKVKEVMPIMYMIADLREPMDDFIYYIQNHIGSLRGEYEPQVFERVFAKVKYLLEDRIENPHLYKF